MPKRKDTELETLNNKWILFIDAYERCLNATRAYMDAYPKASYETARRAASVLMTNHDIRAEIKKRMSNKIMSSEEVLRRLSDQAEATLKPFIRVFEGNIYFDFSHEEANDYLHLVKKVKTKKKIFNEGDRTKPELWEHEWVEVELHDAQKALEILAKYHNLFSDAPINNNNTMIILNVGMDEDDI